MPKRPPKFWMRPVQRLFQVYKNNTQAACHYLVKNYPEDITFLEASPGCAQGWQAVVTGKLQIHPVPGPHGKMMQPPQVSVLGKCLQRCLDNTGYL